MCLLFVRILTAPEHAPSTPYVSIILANNRDEFYDRPTAPADFHWSGPGGRCVGGKDLQPGTSGGSWLVTSETGRVACLLNVLQKEYDVTAASRGGLAVNYAVGSGSTEQYLQQVDAKSHTFNGFHLVLLERVRGAWQLWHYGNRDKASMQCCGAGVYGFDNSHHWSEPWRKRAATQRKFTEITDPDQSGPVAWERREKLTEDLLTILKDKTQHGPDPLITAHSGTKSTDPCTRSATSFCDKERRYGTRTHSIILVSSDGQVEVREYTIQEPGDLDSPTWNSSTHLFQFRSTNHSDQTAGAVSD